MKLMETDHLPVLLDPRHRQHDRLVSKLESTDEIIALSIVVVEEQMRGWLAQIRRVNDVHKQIVPYIRLQKFVMFVRDWQVVVWNEPAADIFQRLRKERVRIGTQDLKIASISLANDAVLLSSNARDFQQVPDLRFEDWLYGP